jgi:hypothetical protein
MISARPALDCFIAKPLSCFLTNLEGANRR